MEFVFNVDPIDIDEPSYKPVSDGKGKRKGAVAAGRRSRTANERLGPQSFLAMWGAAGILLTVVIGGWYYFLPLTYGKPGLTAEQVVARKWLGYDLHFAK